MSRRQSRPSRNRRQPNIPSSKNTVSDPNKLSPKESTLINSLQSKIANNKIIDKPKDLSDLKKYNRQNYLFDYGTLKITILFYLMMTFQYENILLLLAGNNTPDPLICDSQGKPILHLLIEMYCQFNKRCLASDEELKQIAFSTLINHYGRSPQDLQSFSSEEIKKQTDKSRKNMDVSMDMLLKIMDVLLKHEPTKQLELWSGTTGRNALQEAVYNENVQIIKKLLSVPNQHQQLLQLSKEKPTPLKDIKDERSSRLEGINRTELTALMMAIYLKNEIIFDLLLQCNPEKQLLVANEDGLLVIHYACMDDNLKFIHRLLEKKTADQLKSEDKLARCPLAIAASEGKLDIIKWLLTTYPEITKAQYGSAMLWACRGWQKEVVEFLLSEVEPTAFLIQGAKKYSLLMFLALPPRSEVTYVEKEFSNEHLSASHAHPSVKQEPSEHALSLILYEAARNTHLNLEIAKLLLAQENYKRQLQIVSDDGDNVLHIAIRRNDIEYIKLLVGYQVPELFLTCNSTGHIPLATALVANNVNMPIIENLLTHFTNEQLNFRDQDDLLPIHATCCFGLLDCMQYIIQRDPKQLEAITGEDKLTLLHYVLDDNIKLSNKKDYIQFLLNQGANVLAMNTNMRNPLHYVCCQGDLEIAKLFLENPRYTEKLLAAKDIYGNMPLHYACTVDNLELVKYLIEKGANVNEPNFAGCSSFHLACFVDNFLLVKYFLISENSEFKLDNPEKGIELAMRYKAKAVLDEFNLHKDWAEKIAELKKRNKEDKKQLADSSQQVITTQSDASSQWEPDNSSSLSISRYKFLLTIGFTAENIKKLSAEIDEAPHKKPRRFHTFFRTDISKPSSFTFHEGACPTDGLSKIRRRDKIPAFLYLDEELLKTQMEAEKVTQPHDNIINYLRSQKLKFDGHHIKKLDSKIAIYEDKIILPNNSKTVITYTHEVKFYQEGWEDYRVLLFPVPTDQHNGVVYVAGRFTKALHTVGAIKDLEKRKNPSALSINWNLNETVRPPAGPH